MIGRRASTGRIRQRHPHWRKARKSWRNKGRMTVQQASLRIRAYRPAADATTPGISTIILHSDLSQTRPHTLREDDHSDEDADTVWITLAAEQYPPEHPGEGRTGELFAVFGKQCLETGTNETGALFPIHATTSRVTDYHRFNVTVGVSLGMEQ